MQHDCGFLFLITINCQGNCRRYQLCAYLLMVCCSGGDGMKPWYDTSFVGKALPAHSHQHMNYQGILNWLTDSSAVGNESYADSLSRYSPYFFLQCIRLLGSWHASYTDLETEKKKRQNQQKNPELDHVSRVRPIVLTWKLEHPVYWAALYMTDKQLVRLAMQAFVKYSRWRALLTGCAPSLSATLAFQSSNSNTCKPACSWVFL